MQTYTGGVFWPMDPRPSEVYFWDIAAALSKQCRYAGHSSEFYSVAQHSVLVSQCVAPENALWALLHDASEAYLVDVPKPIKPYLDNYQELERVVMDAVLVRFGLGYAREMPEEVKEMDQRILANEQAALMPNPPRDWGLKPAIPNLKIDPITDTNVAESLFISRMFELQGGQFIAFLNA